MSKKVLVVCSATKGRINPFISEQVESLRTLGIRLEYFTIDRKGLRGYLSHLIKLKEKIRDNKYDLVHAHYGLSGLLCVLQRKVPVIITFHGSDVNQPRVLFLSRIAARLASHSILVEQSFAAKLKLKKKFSVIPCGVDTNLFFPLNKRDARQQLNRREDERLVLFASHFANPVKNFPLAQRSIEQIPGVELLEMKGLSRHQVHVLMNAADALLLTSFSEGSPQVVKEALACNLPVVSTPVGDVPQILQGTTGNHLVPYDENEIASCVRKVLASPQRTNARNKILDYDLRMVAMKIDNIYTSHITRDGA